MKNKKKIICYSLLIVQVRTMKLEMEQSEQSHQKQVNKLEQSVR